MTWNLLQWRGHGRSRSVKDLSSLPVPSARKGNRISEDMLGFGDDKGRKTHSSG